MFQEVSRSTPRGDIACERHYSVKELMELWGLSRQTVWRMFRNEPGVMLFGTAETRHTRGRASLRVPESVVVRVHRRMRQ